MQTLNSQRGMSLLGMLIIAMMVGFFIMAGIRIAPSYIEYLTVKEVVERAASEHSLEEDTIADVRRKLSTLLNTNQVYDIDFKDIEVFREDGKTWIDARYEVRVPMLWRIDAVVKYDDLLYEAGRPVEE
jgi:type II secretory pathway pseudopilin PulG